MSTTLKIHELAEELDPEEAGRMKQQSRVEAAQRQRRANPLAGKHEPATASTGGAPVRP